MIELSASQYDIWTTEQILGSASVALSGSVLYDKNTFPYTYAEMENAIQKVIHCNDALRIQIISNGIHPLQEVSDHLLCVIEKFQFQNMEAFQKWAMEKAGEPIGDKGCLYSFSIIDLPAHRGLFIRIHHIISDAWSIALVVSQFNRALLGSDDLGAYSFVDHVKKTLDCREKARRQQDLSFYVKQYEANSGLLLYSTNRNDEHHARRATFQIPSDVRIKLECLANQSKVSLLSVFLSLFSIYFNRTEMNISHFFLGTTLLNRYGMADRNTVGMFVNTVPVAISLNPESSFDANLEQVQSSVMGVMRHSRCSYTEILKEIRKMEPGVTQLFDVSINYHNAAIHDADGLPYETRWYPSQFQSEALQISIEDRDLTGNLFVHYDYRIDCFDEALIQKMHQAIEILADDVLENRTTPVRDLSVMSKDEYHWVTHRASRRPWPFQPVNLGSWFKDVSMKYPDQTAVETSKGTLTYRQLDSLSDQYAVGIISSGVKRGQCVALLMERDINLPVMILAVMKAGATFLLLDQEYPEERIRFMIDHCKAACVIEDKNVHSFLSPSIPDHWQPDGALTDLCYFIYTSGSTGLPKCVQITQANIVNNIFWRLRAYPERNRRIISVTGVASDTFLEDYFYALFSGNTLCLVKDRKNLAEIKQTVELAKNNDIMTTPTFFSAIMEAVPMEYFGNVTLVGENLSESLAEQILSHGIKLHNEYGPSECTICATHAIVEHGPVHIGCPIDNAQVYILDQYLKPVPIGVKGELCIAGQIVGNGYLGLPEQNEKRFLKNILGSDVVYRTGDIACWHEDGSISLIGRFDNQVKMLGLRIELEEIEKQLNALPGIDNSAVVIHKGKKGQQTLCAFYTGDELSSEHLIGFIEKKLPRHMIPQVLIHLDQMPMSANGKIERKALPLHMIDAKLTSTEYVEPQTWQEKQLCKIAGELLDVPQWGMLHHFFMQGGDSLKAMEFVSLAGDQGIHINLQMVYDHPTVQELSNEIMTSGKSKVTYDPAQFDRIHQKLCSFPCTPKTKAMPGNILLTGSTGFLGAQFVRECMEQSTGDLWCIVRGESNEHALRRFMEYAAFYHGDHFVEAAGNRIKVLAGDLSKPEFGLDHHTYQSLLEKIHLVIHTAGNVKHFGQYQDFYANNVLATEHVIAFCRESAAKLIHCSTASILSGVPEGKKEYDESDFYSGQPLDNVYLHTKFEAEKSVLNEVCSGMPARIMRLGNLTNRSRDMCFQINPENNAFLQRLRMIAKMGAFPSDMEQIPIDFTPVDEAARAIMTAALYFDSSPFVLNILHPRRITLSELIAQMKEEGIPIQSVPADEFVEKMRSYHGSILVTDLDENGRLSFPEERVSCEKSCAWLNQAGFHWSSDIKGYIKQYLQYYQSIGYWRNET